MPKAFIAFYVVVPLHFTEFMRYIYPYYLCLKLEQDWSSVA